MSKDKTHRTEINLYLDVVLTAAFLISLKPFTTGIALHEWLGLALGVGLAIHAALHWRWIVGITAKLFGKLPAKTRVYYALDATLLAAFVTIIVTGVLMSRTVLPLFGLRGVMLFPLPLVHAWASYVTLALIGVKLVLHWTWIKNTVSRYVIGQRHPLSKVSVGDAQSPALVPVAVEQRGAAQKISRRRFLLIGCSAVGVAVLASVNKSRRAQGDAVATPTGISSDAAALTGATTPVADAPAATVAVTATVEPSAAPAEPLATLTVIPTVTPAPQRVATRCPRGLVNDPYPGRCNRYVDKNGNGFCDLSQT